MYSLTKYQLIIHYFYVKREEFPPLKYFFTFSLELQLSLITVPDSITKEIQASLYNDPLFCLFPGITALCL